MKDQERIKVKVTAGRLANKCGMVMVDHRKFYTLAMKHTPYYPMVAKMDTVELSEEEFIKEYGRYW